MPEKNRLKLLEISKKFQIPIVEDECYADLIWDSSRPPALAALDEGNEGNSLWIFSKTIAPALRNWLSDWQLECSVPTFNT